MLNFIQNRRIIQVTQGRDYKSFIFIIFLNTSFLFGQNLVPNPSFEDTVYCPSSMAQPNAVASWFNPTQASPDYYNVCSLTGAGVPVNDVGYQNAQEGNGYIGLITIFTSEVNYREYYEVELLEELEIGKTYYWCLYVSATDSCDYISNNIGISLSSTIVQNNNQTLLLSPVVGNYSSIISESKAWKKISGEFIASGGEKYLVLGNFYNDSQTNVLQTLSNTIGGEGAYYYIDNVYLGETPCEEQEYKIPNVITPNNDGVNDRFVLDFEYRLIQIYNRWGQLVFESDNFTDYWDGTFDGKEVADGNYFYIVNVEDKVFKGFVHVIK